MSYTLIFTDSYKKTCQTLCTATSRTEIVEDFPELTDDDITACLQFAADRERQSVTIKALYGE